MEILITRPNPICDFCSSSEVVIAYLIEDFTLPEFGWGSRGAFAACHDCMVLIENGQKKELRERSAKRYTTMFRSVLLKDMAETFVARLHDEFWKRLLKN